MLSYPLIHPQILSSLGASGHGSKVLIADGNFPNRTASSASADIVYLNVAPGLLTVFQILEVLLTAIPVEAATVMKPAEGMPDPDAFARFESALSLPLERLERFRFYETARSSDVSLIIASGDEAPYANLLLTIGVNATAEPVQ